MSIVRWEPLEEMKGFFDNFLDTFPAARGGGWDLAVDVYEEGNNIIAELNAPGIDPDQIEISVHQDLLTLSGSREQKEEKKTKNYFSREIRRGSFSRTVRLPSDVDANNAKANYKNGVLQVVLPKKLDSKSNKVTIKVEK